MNEMTILFHVGSLPVTAFSLCMVAGVLLGLVLTVIKGRKAPGVDATLSLGVCTMLGALLGARLLYCLTMLEFILVDLGGPEFLFQPWQGGYTLYGGVLGGAAGAFLYAKVTKRPAAPMLDLAAMGGAVALTFLRAGEYFTTQGLGEYVDAEAWQRFPFAVQSVYEDWQIPVFAYEAAAALLIAILLCALMRKRPAGWAAETFVILLGLSQIILESLREDEFIRFGFVRLNQLAAAITMAFVFFPRLIRHIKRSGWTPWQVIRLILFLLGIVTIIILEFALDKWTVENYILYIVMALTLTIMGIAQTVEGK